MSLILQTQLRDQIKVLESGSSEEMERLKKELADWEMKLESHVNSYKEQIRQHSVTICTLEERLNKVVKKNKDYQAEITQLKHGELKASQLVVDYLIRTSLFRKISISQVAISNWQRYDNFH